MKSFVILFIVFFLFSCSNTKKPQKKTFRTIAELDSSLEDLSTRKLKKNVTRILHSYLIGQILLEKFDKKLDTQGSDALTSDEYNELQAIRVLVDGYEEEVNKLYLDLVLIDALPKYSQRQKSKAQKGLKIINQFMKGMTFDQKSIPVNLQHLVLSNLKEKQHFLLEELEQIRNESTITMDDPNVIRVIDEHMVILQEPLKKSLFNIRKYSVNKKLLKEMIKTLENDEEFKNYKIELKAMSLIMKKNAEALNVGRSTSSDVIYPSSGLAGNITGRGFPENTWSLTYDDGPGSKTSSAILKNLQDRGLKATFFMLARQVESLYATADSIAKAGMDIASHSYDHAQLTKVGPQALEKQIGGSKKIIEEKLGKPIKLFRLPYGAGVSVSSIRSQIAVSNMIHVFWNVDTLDWQDKNPTSIFNRSLKQMKASPKNAGIILFHDIHQQSVIASTMIMDYLKEKKLNVCTVQAVVDQINHGTSTCTP